MSKRDVYVHPLFVHPHALETRFSVRNAIEEHVQKLDLKRWSETPDPEQTCPPLPEGPVVTGAPLFAFVKGILP